jgi:hypothetical protein
MSFPQLEFHHVYNQWSSALSPDEYHPWRLCCICETVGSLFDETDPNAKMSLEHNQLMEFFTRWLVLLEPFARFSCVSSEMTSYLQLLFKSIAGWVARLGVDSYENGTKFRPIHGLFYEFFSFPRTVWSWRRDFGSTSGWSSRLDSEVVESDAPLTGAVIYCVCNSDR